MQDFEVRRYNEACVDFERAFHASFQAELGAMTKVEGDTASKVPSDLKIEVDFNDVVDGIAAEHRWKFEEAGRSAARAAHRTREPVFRGPGVAADAERSGSVFMKNMLTWTISLR